MRKEKFHLNLVVIGHVEIGILKSGMNVTFAPGNLSSEVKLIELLKKLIEEVIKL